MIQFRINGKHLVMHPGTAVEIEEQHPILSQDLKDAFTVPVEVPIAGNESVLGHIHVLERRDRPLRIDNAELWVDGSPKHRGVFYVESSVEGPDGSVSLSFTVDGFISAMAGLRLRDVDYGGEIVFLSAGHLVSAATTYNTMSWPDARFCYPMISNPEAYASNNPDWYNEPAAYDAATSYDVTDPPTLITYETGLVRRKRAYECIGTAPAGESPDNTPWDWRFFGQGIINPWIPTTTGWRLNDELNNNAMCPQFYLKDILIRAMRDRGLEAVGDFIDDPSTHQVIVWNNQLLDMSENTGHVLATQPAPITYTAVDPNTDHDQLHWSNGFDFILTCSDEVTAPNEDPDGLWDGQEYDIAAAGTHNFKIRVKLTCPTPIYVQVTIINAATNERLIEFYAGSMADRRNNWDFVCEGSRGYTAGEVGMNCRVIITPRLFGTDNAGAVGNISFTLSDCYFEAWRGTGEVTNGYTRIINPADHVPDITIEHLLLEVRDWFHVRIQPMPELGVVRFDHQQDVLDGLPVSNLTQHVRAPLRLEHANRTTGMRLAPPTGKEENLPDLSAHIDDGEYDAEADLPAAGTELHKAFIRNTAQMVVSKLYDTNKYAWFIAGTLHRVAEVGEMTNPREVTPEFGMPDMDLVPAVDGTLCLMPVIKETCSSPMFNLGNNAPGLYFMLYAGMRPAIQLCANGVTLVGGANAGINGNYCPDEDYEGQPVWTRQGGTYLADSIYYEPEIGKFVITVGGTFADDSTNVKQYTDDTILPDTPPAVTWFPYYGSGPYTGGGQVPSPTNEASPSSLPYPLATPFAYDQVGTGLDHASVSYDENDPRSAFTLFWKRWAEALANSETVTTTIERTSRNGGKRIPIGKHMLHNQVVLIDQLSTRYMDGSRDPVLAETRLLRLRNP